MFNSIAVCLMVKLVMQIAVLTMRHGITVSCPVIKLTTVGPIVQVGVVASVVFAGDVVATMTKLPQKHRQIRCVRWHVKNGQNT